MKRAGQTVYFAIAALIFLGFFYLGVTREFTTVLDVGFVAVLWVFVVIAMKTGLVKTAPGAGLPLSNLRVKFDARNLLLAIVSAVLAVAWSAMAGHFLKGNPLNDTWLGVVIAFGSPLLLLVLMIRFTVNGLKITFGRR